MNLPKISIVTAVFNCADYIEAAVESVLLQGYPDLEYVVIDGGSTDGTAEKIGKYASHLSYFVSENDLGQTYALNKGFAKTTGDVLAWLNADEEYLCGTLEKVGMAFLENPGLDLLYGQSKVVDEKKNEIGERRYPSMSPKYYMMYGMGVLPTEATFWSRRVHNFTGELDQEHFPRIAMDYDWLLRMSFHIRKWQRTEDFLSLFTERPERITRNAGAVEMLKASTYARKKCLEKNGIRMWKVKLFWFFTRLRLRAFEKRLLRVPDLPNILNGIKVWAKE
jgi:glycosyltransferase involved in cell wall biosynthesis